jgi:hypothetical protein
MTNRSFLHLGQSPAARRASTLLEEEEEATSMGSAQVALSMPLGLSGGIRGGENIHRFCEPNSSQYREV